ncbi:uncharacterized protein [Solanum tuberosum]|uniref:P18 protein n=2 Tax=Solanum TaxID=4107 RepID=M1CCI2_SOLTU|nr:PREDICTED: uncharacterized protein LOC107062935 [Solanum tuberosum]XP_049391378.1 uncharacterized protein LOC125855675 [Solanum stenotomum]
MVKHLLFVKMHSLHKVITFQFPLFCFFLLLSPLYSNAAVAPLPKPNNNNNALVEKACTYIPDKPFCLNYLKSNPKVISKSNPLEFALAIIQSGADDAKNIHAYLSKPKGKQSPQAIQAYKDCKTNWENLASGLERSVKFIKEEQGYGYDTTDYDLKVNLDKANWCGNALESARIQDPVIAQGVKKVSLAVMGADAILVGVKPPKKLD